MGRKARDRQTSERALVEGLEGRRLLTTGPITIGDAPGAQASSLIYPQSYFGGELVEIRLTGGLATISWDWGGDWTISKGKAVVTAESRVSMINLSGTTLKSKLVISNPGTWWGERWAGVDGITGSNVALGTLDARTTGIGTEGVHIDGGVSVVHLGGVGDGANLRFGDTGFGRVTFTAGRIGDASLAFGGSSSSKLTFRAGEVANASLSFPGTIRRLSVDGWATGSISGGSVATIVSRGSFGASVTAPGGIGAVSVHGTLSGSLIADDGAIGKVKVTGKSVMDWAILGLTRFRYDGAITSPEIRAGESIGGISVKGSIGGDAPVALSAGTSVGIVRARTVRYMSDEIFPDPRHGYPKFRYEYDDALADIRIVLMAGGQFGGLSVVGGDIVDGVIQASRVGNISAQAIPGTNAAGDSEWTGGNIRATITSSSTIGAIRARHGSITDMTLNARDGIGAISAVAAVESAVLRGDSLDHGGVNGGNIDLHIHLDGATDGSSTPASLGQISAWGGNITVDGTVFFAPGQMRLNAIGVRYVQTYAWVPQTDGTERYVKVWETAGGSIENLVEMLQA